MSQITGTPHSLSNYYEYCLFGDSRPTTTVPISHVSSSSITEIRNTIYMNLYKLLTQLKEACYEGQIQVMGCTEDKHAKTNSVLLQLHAMTTTTLTECKKQATSFNIDLPLGYSYDTRNTSDETEVFSNLRNFLKTSDEELSRQKTAEELFQVAHKAFFQFQQLIAAFNDPIVRSNPTTLTLSIDRPILESTISTSPIVRSNPTALTLSIDRPILESTVSASPIPPPTLSIQSQAQTDIQTVDIKEIIRQSAEHCARINYRDDKAECIQAFLNDIYVWIPAISQSLPRSTKHRTYEGLVASTTNDSKEAWMNKFNLNIHIIVRLFTFNDRKDQLLTSLHSLLLGITNELHQGLVLFQVDENPEDIEVCMTDMYISCVQSEFTRLNPEELNHAILKRIAEFKNVIDVPIITYDYDRAIQMINNLRNDIIFWKSLLKNQLQEDLIVDIEKPNSVGGSAWYASLKQDIDTTHPSIIDQKGLQQTILLYRHLRKLELFHITSFSGFYKNSKKMEHSKAKKSSLKVKRPDADDEKANSSMVAFSVRPDPSSAPSAFVSSATSPLTNKTQAASIHIPEIFDQIRKSIEQLNTLAKKDPELKNAADILTELKKKIIPWQTQLASMGVFVEECSETEQITISTMKITWPQKLNQRFEQMVSAINSESDMSKKLRLLSQNLMGIQNEILEFWI